TLRVIRDAHAARLCDTFKSGRNVSAIAENVVVVKNDVADVNADAEFDPEIEWHRLVLSGHAALYLHRATRGINGAGELDQHAIAGSLDDADPIGCDCRIDKRLSKHLELGERSFFVPPHQTAIACDICSQNSRQS